MSYGCPQGRVWVMGVLRVEYGYGCPQGSAQTGYKIVINHTRL